MSLTTMCPDFNSNTTGLSVCLNLHLTLLSYRKKEKREVEGGRSRGSWDWVVWGNINWVYRSRRQQTILLLTPSLLELPFYSPQTETTQINLEEKFLLVDHYYLSVD